MRYFSPLRYPGGKRRLTKFIAGICDNNNIDGHYIEPYAGGASVALYLLFNQFVSEITINDYDRAVYAFWYSVLYNTNKFCHLIKKAEISIENWYRQKEIQFNKDTERDLLKLGFSTFFLNRTNYSGIIDGGVIGGISQKGKYKIDCRFNKDELISRIKLIAIHKRVIHVSNLDALQLIKLIKKNKNTIFYFDPPYYIKGPSLYMNHYKHDDHVKVSEAIKSIKNAKWLVSYDNTPEIRKMYDQCKQKKYAFYHTAYSAKIGKEIMFFSNNLSIPRTNLLAKV